MAVFSALGLALGKHVLVTLGAALALVALLAATARVPLAYNIRNVTVRWGNTLLTGVAFAIVVGLLVAMMGFVNGLYALTENSGKADNVIVLSDGATDEAFSSLGSDTVANVPLQKGVRRGPTGQPLASKEAYIICSKPIPAADGKRPRRRLVQLRGMEDPAVAAEVHGVRLAAGTLFSDAGVRETAPGKPPAIEAILAGGIARTLGGDAGKPTLGIGDTFSMADREWVVVGLMDSAGSTFDSEVWAKQAVVGQLFGKASFTTVVLKAESPAAAVQLARFLANEYKAAQLTARTEPEYFAGLQGTNLQFLGAAIVVAAVMAIGGVFGVMNTMFAAINSRVKDIGVLRILGYSRSQVLVSFFLESLLLAILGGLVGCGIGWLTDGASLTSTIGSGQGGGKTVVMRTVVNAQTLGLGMLFALAMGAVGGLVPALSAMRLRPLESMR